jgi:hypothetical protein
MMNISKLVSLTILVSLAAAGCGKYDKDPVAGSGQEGQATLEDLRKHSGDVIAQGPEQAGPKVIYEPKEVRVEVEKIVYVEKPVYHEQSTVNESSFVITPDSDMNFIEGKKSTFKIRARSLIKDVKVKLVAQNLPEGAKIENISNETEKDVYALTWAPSYYTVAANEAAKTLKIKLSLQVTGAKTEKERAALEGLVREKEVSLLVFKDQTPPSDMKIESLSATVSEGTQVSFQVIVTVPGIDGNSTQKPSLLVSYDGVSYTAGNDFLELDGSRYVIGDLNKIGAEYLGESKWRFHRVFDTKNTPLQTQLAKDGSVMKNADGLRVRFSLKVYSPYGSSTPEVLRQVKIAFSKKEEAK